MGLNIGGAWISGYDSNYFPIKENIPSSIDTRGNNIENSIRFSNHSPANFRPTFGNWQGGTRAEFDNWADSTIQDIHDLRSGNTKAYQERQTNRRFESLQKSADYWRAQGNEQAAQSIEKDIAKQKKAIGSQEKVQNPEAENKTVKMLTDGKAGGYTLDHLLKNHPDVTIISETTESIDPSTLKRIQGWTRESKLNDWKDSKCERKRYASS